MYRSDLRFKCLIKKRFTNEARNKLTIYAVLCCNGTIFYRQELASLFQVRKNRKCAKVPSETFRVAVYR